MSRPKSETVLIALGGMGCYWRTRTIPDEPTFSRKYELDFAPPATSGTRGDIQTHGVRVAYEQLAVAHVPEDVIEHAWWTLLRSAVDGELLADAVRVAEHWEAHPGEVDVVLVGGPRDGEHFLLPHDGHYVPNSDLLLPDRPIAPAINEQPIAGSEILPLVRYRRARVNRETGSWIYEVVS